MTDPFYVGYDLRKAGYKFSTANRADAATIELLNTISEDFTKISISKAGVSVNKEQIMDLLIAGMPAFSEAESIVVLSIKDGMVNKRNINRQSALFTELFDENF